MMDFLMVRVTVVPAKCVNTEKQEEERCPKHCNSAQGHPNPFSLLWARGVPCFLHGSFISSSVKLGILDIAVSLA